MLQDFCGRFLARTPPKKGSTKLGFFIHCIQDSPISSFRLQKTGSAPQFSGSYLPSVKDTYLFLTCAGEILLLPLPIILDTYLRFLTTPGVRRGKNAFSLPHIGVIALSSAGSLVTITGGTLFHGQGNRQSRHHHPRAPQDFA